MVEIKGRDGQGNDTVKLPNNIRQVGTPGDKIKIYLEDYVMTYLNQIAGQKPFGQKAALLLGEKVKKDRADIFFVSAAIQMEQLEIHEDSFQVTAEMWSGLYERIEKYFGDRHILGWYLSRPGQAVGINSQIEKMQAEQFSEKGLLFYTADPMDREDAFYLYDRGKLVRQQGYYIYYERNEAMQNYMIETRGQETAPKQEENTGFQNRLFERKTDNKIRKENYGRGRRGASRWLPQAAALLLVVLVAAAVRKNMQINSVAVNNTVSESVNAGTENSPVYEDTVDIVDSVMQQAAESIAEGENGQNTEGGTNNEAANEEIGGNGESASQSGAAGASTGRVSQSGAAGASTGSAGTAGDGTESTGESGAAGEGTGSAGTAGDGTESTGETDEAAASSGTPGSYTVQAGDTLLKISRNFYQDAAHVEEIIRLNQIENPDYIYPGMVLQLP